MAEDLSFVPDLRVDSVNCYLANMPKPYTYRVSSGEFIRLYILLVHL